MIILRVILVFSIWSYYDCFVRVFTTKFNALKTKEEFLATTSTSTLYLSNDSNSNNNGDLYSNSNNDDIDANNDNSATVYTKKKIKFNDKRDLLPFDVFMEKNPDIKIGSFLLDSSTACGDMLDLGPQGIFNIMKVSFLYKYEMGHFKVFKKKLLLTNNIKGKDDVVNGWNEIISPFRSDGNHDDHLNYLQ